MQRQGSPISPTHSATIFVYTYELPAEDQGNQIYEAMNRAMRLMDLPRVRFWRPLIWHLTTALDALPPCRGQMYRGINCRFSSDAYGAGKDMCMMAFTSVSSKKTVAEGFVQGQEGTLFFIDAGGARDISMVSRFPEEGEYLFRPATVFTVVSTLQGDSTIGHFYSSVDNIAMKEREAARPAAGGQWSADRAAGACDVVIKVPAGHPHLQSLLLDSVLHAVGQSHFADLEAVETVEAGDCLGTRVAVVPAAPIGGFVAGRPCSDLPSPRACGSAHGTPLSPGPSTPATGVSFV